MEICMELRRTKVILLEYYINLGRWSFHNFAFTSTGTLIKWKKMQDNFHFETAFYTFIPFNIFGGNNGELAPFINK